MVSKADGSKVCPETRLCNPDANEDALMVLIGLLKKNTSWLSNTINAVKCQLAKLRYQLSNPRTSAKPHSWHGMEKFLGTDLSSEETQLKCVNQHQWMKHSHLKSFPPSFSWSYKRRQLIVPMLPFSRLAKKKISISQQLAIF